MIFNFINFGFNFPRIAKIIMLDRLEVFIQFIDERDPGRDVHAEDLFFGNIVQIFHQRPEAVAVGRDEDFFPVPDHRGHDVVPKRKNARDRILEAFREWKIAFPEAFVARIFGRIAGIVFLKGRRRDIIAPAPDLDLVIAVFCGGLGFVESL